MGLQAREVIEIDEGYWCLVFGQDENEYVTGHAVFHDGGRFLPISWEVYDEDELIAAGEASDLERAAYSARRAWLGIWGL